MADPTSKTREEDKKELSTLLVEICFFVFFSDKTFCRIKANGGTLATIPKQQSPIFLVYGGTRKRSWPFVVPITTLSEIRS
jgi:hypothetical protein